MAGKDIIEMSLREVRRLKVVQEAIDRHITQRVAASMIGLSERQVRRLISSVREEGDRGALSISHVVYHQTGGYPIRSRTGLYCFIRRGIMILVLRWPLRSFQRWTA